MVGFHSFVTFQIYFSDYGTWIICLLSYLIIRVLLSRWLRDGSLIDKDRFAVIVRLFDSLIFILKKWRQVQCDYFFGFTFLDM